MIMQWTHNLRGESVEKRVKVLVLRILSRHGVDVGMC
jgi:hypothetical protein